jgi:Cys-rich repeat protein
MSCTQDSDCTPNVPICNKVRGICIECNLNTDCEVGFGCVNNICVAIPPCTTDIDCAVNSSYNRCLEDKCVECIINEHCGYGQQCETNKCYNINQIKFCNHSYECDQGYSCVKGVCEKSSSKIYFYILCISIISITLFILFIRLRNSKK